VKLIPGQASDSLQLPELFHDSTRKVPDAAAFVGDRGFDCHAHRDLILEAGMKADIPTKKNAKSPWPHDEENYRERNRVERLIGKMKQFRAVATRYDKLGESFLSVIQLVLSFIKARSIVNRP